VFRHTKHAEMVAGCSVDFAERYLDNSVVVYMAVMMLVVAMVGMMDNLMMGNSLVGFQVVDLDLMAMVYLDLMY